jgi:hypothetical protein
LIILFYNIQRIGPKEKKLCNNRSAMTRNNILYCSTKKNDQCVNLSSHYYNLITMESIDVLPPEKIAFIAYNIGVYESVQKFGGLITSGRITNGTDVSKIAELLLESSAFYDAEMISSLINTMLHYTRNSIIESITAAQVVYVMSQLKASGVSLP